MMRGGGKGKSLVTTGLKLFLIGEKAAWVEKKKKKIA